MHTRIGTVSLGMLDWSYSSLDVLSGTALRVHRSLFFVKAMG